jgi:hypothetical protein
VLCGFMPDTGFSGLASGSMTCIHKGNSKGDEQLFMFHYLVIIASAKFQFFVHIFSRKRYSEVTKKYKSSFFLNFCLAFTVGLQLHGISGSGVR